MHQTALDHARLFFQNYVPNGTGISIVEIGSLDVNGSLRQVAPNGCKYVGVDFAEGKGVDVILTDPYILPFGAATFDVCLTSSCFEHSEFFWLSFLEIARIVKQNGLIYLNAPSNGDFHRYPVDCWRFYPDSGFALQNWARRNGHRTTLLESFVGNQRSGVWNDFVAVFVNDDRCSEQYSNRMVSTYSDYTNGRMLGLDEILNYSVAQEDQRWLSRRIRKRMQRTLGKPE